MTVQVICQALLQSIAKLLKLGKSEIKRVRGDLLPALKLDKILLRVNDGARTHDNRNHNPGLYQLSYTHH